MKEPYRENDRSLIVCCHVERTKQFNHFFPCRFVNILKNEPYNEVTEYFASPLPNSLEAKSQSDKTVEAIIFRIGRFHS
jgi:hypothetical protein